ncbi:fas-associated death domain protein [Pararge aegeria]|uniref:Jg15096 protein n=3 Tax=Pararge aegeria TaxID=116150 RepID=A0A8S4RI17_9NEOP|nr:fas-associated death domain protein [Pararge aegeria]CAH2236100.1 jg15096 [Pararge aegeria aegeria]
MTLSEYTHLKQQIVLNLGKSDNRHLLLKLKEFYKDDIDSERKYEQVNTIGQLLKILEIRDVLSEDDIGPLKEIARRLNNNELLQRISDYEISHVPREYVNYYALENKLPAFNKEKTETGVNNQFFIPQDKTQRIKDTIIEEIGRYWRDLARNLKIREIVIEDIDSKHQALSEKAKDILDTYFERCDKQRWFYTLCEALEKSRRKDLCRSIQEIMVMNI